MSWQSYPLHSHGRIRRGGRAVGLQRQAASAFPRGHILHDYLEARVLPKIIGPVGARQSAVRAMWKAAQRMTTRPVKFGTIMPELLAASVEDNHYKDPSSAPGRSATRSTRSCTISPMPAAR